MADTANKSHIILLSNSLPIDTQSITFLGETSSQPTRLVGSHILTLEKVQQIVLSALSTLGIQGKPTGTSTTLLVDSGASNHMTGSLDHLYNAHAYDGTQNIHIVHGNTTSIFVVRDINSIL